MDVEWANIPLEEKYCDSIEIDEWMAGSNVSCDFAEPFDPWEEFAPSRAMTMDEFLAPLAPTTANYGTYVPPNIEHDLTMDDMIPLEETKEYTFLVAMDSTWPCATQMAPTVNSVLPPSPESGNKRISLGLSKEESAYVQQPTKDSFPSTSTALKTKASPRPKRITKKSTDSIPSTSTALKTVAGPKPKRITKKAKTKFPFAGSRSFQYYFENWGKSREGFSVKDERCILECLQDWKKLTRVQKQPFYRLVQNETPKKPKAKPAPSEKPPRKQRQRKDPESPKRFRTSFICFLKHHRREVALNHAHLTSNQVSAKLGRMWNQLSSEAKKPYEEMFVKDKQRYENAMKEWLTQQKNGR